MPLHNHENRNTLALASIFAFRMLGLFMILPVFSIFAHQLSGATPFLIGMALGIYGLTQATLQIPFGMLSDRFGRKPIITIGLLLFAIGSVIAALSHSITGIIIGRALQGSGAIGSTLIALIADLTREENRTKAMAIVGMVIAFSFFIALIAGPLLNAWIGVNGIFWVTAAFAMAGLLILHGIVPTPLKSLFHSDSEAQSRLFKSVLRNAELLRLDAGIFIQHAILTAIFIVIPIALQRLAGLAENQQWLLYLPVFAVSFALMLPLIIIAEKKRLMKPIFVLAIAATCISLLCLGFWHHSVMAISIGLVIYFTAFNLLEASLPSLISKISPAGSKGTAMGVYSTSQFSGIFFGGILGGWLYGQFHIMGVLFACAGLSLLWLAVALTMQKPKHLSTQLLNLGRIDATQVAKIINGLKQIQGIEDVAISVEEGIAYLKVDKQRLSSDDLSSFVAKTKI